MRRTVAVLALAGALAVTAVPAGGTEGWVRERYEVAAAGQVPGASYTLIESVDGGAKRTVRVLFASGNDRLVADVRVKTPHGGGESRWIELTPVTGKDRLSIAVVAGTVELDRGGARVTSFPLAGAIPEGERVAVAELVRTLEPGFRKALVAFARIGLEREPAFFEEARALAAALFPDMTNAVAPIAPAARRRLTQVLRFDPAKHPPLPDERPFGAAYGIPGHAAAPAS
ncbi:MAG: hypothetical protein KBD01_11560 [Acidobacteria bacterium]|nr:hypothetical protein [Acidobacteriota bacterium]